MAVSLNDFLELLSCNYTVHYNVYDSMGNSILKEKEACSIEENIFPACGFISRLFQAKDQIDGPVLLSTILGIYWIAVVTGSTQESFRVHVLGPIAEYPFERSEAANLLSQYLENIPHGQTAPVMHALMRIPVIPALTANQYALMFYYSLKNRKCALSDIIHIEQNLRDSILDTAGRASTSDTEANSAYTAFKFESELIQAVRNGDMNILVSMYDTYAKVNPEGYDFMDSTRDVKDIAIIFLAYNTHAAIEGGLSPETAYQLRRQYLHMIEQSQTIFELSTINTTSFEDFVTRVHNHHFANSSCSTEILHCQEYIRLHIEENLDLARLAGHFHYTIYYFSRKFKAECGVSITDYIKQQKTERAKLLLKTTQLTIKEISEQLSFESVNTFCAVFRKCAGMSPTAFRNTLKPSF
ncbi:MAG: helix-turn-helix transcriptional regulator [Lachnospiraceae bacterium]|nr:helix-turn-helix transcriptional regulator [Lachnospiraceae bacterium]